MADYTTYASGNFKICIHQDIGTIDEEVTGVVSKTEDGACVTLRFANGDERQVIAPDFVQFLGDN